MKRIAPETSTVLPRVFDFEPGDGDTTTVLSTGLFTWLRHKSAVARNLLIAGFDGDGRIY